MNVKTPRLAGARLRALAKLLAVPGVGERLARLAIRERLIKPLRRHALDHPEPRSIILFRAQPRFPAGRSDGDP